MRRSNRRRERGQSAVEFVALVPIFLILFAIMYQLFGISFNAQYTHIKSRSLLMDNVEMKPCPEAAAGTQGDASITQDLTFTSAGNSGPAPPIRKQSVIKCN